MRPSLLILLLLAGCAPDPNMKMYEQSNNADQVSVHDNQRVKVTRVGVFRDDLAYNGRRGVYVIQDEYTGQEFIGVSGIGISQLGSHSVASGKVVTQHQDER